MGKVVQLGTGVHLSISSLASETGKTRETVAKRLKDAKVKPSGKRSGWPVYRLKEALPAILSGSADGHIDPDRLDPHARRAWYQGEHEKLRLEQERRELVPRLEVEQEMASTLKIAAEFFDTLTDVLERDCGASPAQLRRMEQELDRVREEMYERMTYDEDADAAGTAGERA